MKIRLLVAYDGSGFAGFAENVGVSTVAGTLRRSLERILDHPIEMACAGRTDAGVHGWGQVVSLTAAATDVDLSRLRDGLNALCGPSIVVREAAVVPDEFDARFSALSRRYRYTILNRRVPDPFLARTAWHIEQPLAVEQMRAAAEHLIGEHDFSSFCRRPKRSEGSAPASLVRQVLETSWTEPGDDLLWFEIEATSFCHQMVRSIVATLVDVGVGKLVPQDVAVVLAARDRAAASQLAPPQGLCLREVRYPDSVLVP